jgi:aspartate oxidase
MIEAVDVDVVVAGGGASGLMAAYRAHLGGARVLLLTGSGGASNRISSLNCALDYEDADTPAGLAADMFRAGGDVNNPDVVAVLTERIATEIAALADLGVPFVRAGDRFARRQATGSSWTRSVYTARMVGADVCRYVLAELERAAAGRVSIVRGGVVTGLDVSAGRVRGAAVHDWRSRRQLHVNAKAVVLATGGAGHLFGTTTNPRGSRGIGYSLALEAGADLVDMEFVSFEPFVISTPAERKGHNLPTTVLRSGARLLNGQEKEFFDTSGGPTKDVICRAMLQEVAEGRGTSSGSVYFDLRDVASTVIEQYPHLVRAVRGPAGPLGPLVLEVMPAQHYMDGGIRIDASTESTIRGLFAVGEVSGGAHGANRLAGAGGLEAVAGGAIAGENAARRASDSSNRERDRPRPRPPAEVGTPDPGALEKIQTALDVGCGILRTAAGLSTAVTAIELATPAHVETPDALATWRSAQIALSIARAALVRAESRGDHWRVDHPARDDARWLGNVVVSAGRSGDVAASFEPALDRQVFTTDS